MYNIKMTPSIQSKLSEVWLCFLVQLYFKLFATLYAVFPLMSVKTSLFYAENEVSCIQVNNSFKRFKNIYLTVGNTVF